MTAANKTSINLALGFRFQDRKRKVYEVFERIHGLDTSYSIEFTNGWTVSYDGQGSCLTHIGFYLIENEQKVGDKIIQKVEDIITWINSNHLLIAEKHGTI